jgi:hypothetical protein
MLTLLLVILIILWLLGYNVPGIVLFHLNGQPITLWSILTLVIIIWVISILPDPFKKIGIVFLILWLLSLLGVLSIAGLSNLIIIALIIALVFFLIRGFY